MKTIYSLVLSLIVFVSLPGYAVDAIYYYHNDHLGTPQMMTDDNQVDVWNVQYTPFGQIGGTATIENNLHLPGQYFDVESGLRYNYFRDYDPTTGRYIQSDPIGLRGGINTYAYVGGNPANFVDTRGLWSTKAHNHLIREFVKDHGFTEEQIRDIERGSAYADASIYQDDDHSFMHAMSSASLSKAEACGLANSFVRDSLFNPENLPQRLRRGQFFQMGVGLHTIMDSTSPAHQGFQYWDISQLPRHGPDQFTPLWDRKDTEEGLSALLSNPALIAETVNRMNDAINGGGFDCSCFN